MHKALLKVLDDATFQLRAREVASFIHVYNWVKDDLAKKLEEKPEPKPKPEVKAKKNGRNSR